MELINKKENIFGDDIAMQELINDKIGFESYV